MYFGEKRKSAHPENVACLSHSAAILRRTSNSRKIKVSKRANDANIVRVRTVCGWSKAMYCPMAPLVDAPTTCIGPKARCSTKDAMSVLWPGRRDR